MESLAPPLEPPGDQAAWHLWAASSAEPSLQTLPAARGGLDTEQQSDECIFCFRWWWEIVSLYLLTWKKTMYQDFSICLQFSLWLVFIAIGWGQLQMIKFSTWQSSILKSGQQSSSYMHIYHHHSSLPPYQDEAQQKSRQWDLPNRERQHYIFLHPDPVGEFHW